LGLAKALILPGFMASKKLQIVVYKPDRLGYVNRQMRETQQPNREMTMSKITYTRIRGPKAEARCSNKSTWGSPLYCECGCQTPHDDDPSINLDGVTVGAEYESDPGTYQLVRDGKPCGSISRTATDYICIDKHEYLGCDKAALHNLFCQPVPESVETAPVSAGETSAETVASVRFAERAQEARQDAENKHHFGWCNKCHSYCYGDCEAN